MREFDVPTVNVAEAGCDSASVAVTVEVPVTDDNCVKVAIKAPLESVVIIVGLVLTAAPAYEIVMVLLEAKLVPVTVTTVPASPVDGFNDITGVLYTAVSWVSAVIVTDLGFVVEPSSFQ